MFNVNLWCQCLFSHSAGAQTVEKKAENFAYTPLGTEQCCGHWPSQMQIFDISDRVFSKYDLRVTHMPSAKLRGKLVNAKYKPPKKKTPRHRIQDPLRRLHVRRQNWKVPETPQGTPAWCKQQHRRECTCRTRGIQSQHWLGQCSNHSKRNVMTRLLVETLVIQTTPDMINQIEGNLPVIYAQSLRHILRA